MPMSSQAFRTRPRIAFNVSIVCSLKRAYMRINWWASHMLYCAYAMPMHAACVSCRSNIDRRFLWTNITLTQPCCLAESFHGAQAFIIHACRALLLHAFTCLMYLCVCHTLITQACPCIPHNTIRPHAKSEVNLFPRRKGCNCRTRNDVHWSGIPGVSIWSKALLLLVAAPSKYAGHNEK